MTGLFIAVEGIDGAGKTTQAERLARYFEAHGRDVVLTKEPTNGPHGQRIRELSTKGAQVSPEDELGYFIEDRKEHLREVIEPALREGKVVITDRYYFSNVAYQGARGMAYQDILAHNEALFPPPDAVFLIEVSPAVGLGRVRARGGELNQSYEREDFLDEAVAIFAKIDRPYVHRIDGAQSPEAVQAQIAAHLDALEQSAAEKAGDGTAEKEGG